MRISDWSSDVCASYYRKGRIWHHLVRHIDRENNRYVETITVLATGELVRHVSEPLTDHVEHGSDRHREPKPAIGTTEDLMHPIPYACAEAHHANAFQAHQPKTEKTPQGN